MEILSPDQQYIRFKCLEARQPIGIMYVGVIDSDDLEKITYTDVRRMELGIDNREIEDYIGIQRQLDINREKIIGRYVNLVDATFPNSIILSISSEFAKYDSETSTMTIDFRDDIAKVLDGQHRIAGLRSYRKDASTFQLAVTIYIDMELEDQAIVFSTINKEQKNVSNSLVADLFAFAETRSPQKTGHNVARALTKKEGSPLFEKIKILGKADKETQSITQDTFVKSLLKYITKDMQTDRDFYRRNKNNRAAKLPYATDKELKTYFLRNIFIDDENDINIAQIIWNYFYAVQQKWPNAWNTVKDNNILNKSTGFIGLMRFFKDAYLSFNRFGDVITKDEFANIFNKINIDEDDFNTQNYIPGTSGQTKLYKNLVEKSRL
jgi:DGQHR domain-containing protein